MTYLAHRTGWEMKMPPVGKEGLLLLRNGTFVIYIKTQIVTFVIKVSVKLIVATDRQNLIQVRSRSVAFCCVFRLVGNRAYSQHFGYLLRIIVRHSWRPSRFKCIKMKIIHKNTTYSQTLTLFAFHTHKKQYLDTLNIQKKREMHRQMHNNDLIYSSEVSTNLPNYKSPQIHKIFK